MNLIYQFSRGDEQLFEDLICVLTGEYLPEREPDESGMNEWLNEWLYKWFFYDSQMTECLICFETCESFVVVCE